MEKIPIEKEPKELYKEFRVYEKCAFCQKETNTWHRETNTPVCNDCAESHTSEHLSKIQSKAQHSPQFLPVINPLNKHLPLFQ